MSFDIIAVPHFRKELKKLSKKHPSLKSDFKKLIDSLKTDPEQGTPLGKNCFKIRMAISSKDEVNQTKRILPLMNSVFG